MFSSNKYWKEPNNDIQLIPPPERINVLIFINYFIIFIMNSLNINKLYETTYQKNIQRLENFDNILKKIHNRIKYNAKIEKTYCFFNIPGFIIGMPLYNINDLKKIYY